ncbi:hypothetical protein [Paracoccus marinus]|uniref:hypothetical protein n=1 Tax=Paracoccus marinus TaxID=288426 RepID=UPI00117C2565|nr:hypothetical protein [Paracoccus marinus]
MVRVARIVLECGVIAGFAVSCLLVALRPDLMRLTDMAVRPTLLDDYAYLAAQSPLRAEDDLVGIIQNPPNIALWGLVATVIASCAAYLFFRSRVRFAPPIQLAAMLGLLAGAIWPWLGTVRPEAALVLAALAPVGVVGALLYEPRPPDHSHWPMGLIAGWLTVSGIGAATALVFMKLNVSSELASLVGLLALSLIGAQVQFSMGKNVSYAVAIIWAMLGIAAASMSLSMTVSTACVLGIATMAVVVVRVTT